MEGLEYFYELICGLPRGGPGDNQSTRKAFGYLKNLPSEPLILDLGCGPGMQTLELAKISNRTIIALDNYQPFLDILMHNATQEGLAGKISPKNQSMLEMDFKNNTFDVIWSEGALYFIGFQNGLGMPSTPEKERISRGNRGGVPCIFYPKTITAILG
jgi:SAM-dependent methyltransferase